ncbi:hypothetical protein EDD11_006746 [Mortierella claussenii]|nr:hypothetical protein EDD11_006746 [Mortierella claussenii]
MDIKGFKAAPPYVPSSSSSSSSQQPPPPEVKKRKPYTKKDGTATKKSTAVATAAASSNSNNTLANTPMNNKGERMTFELDDVLRKYSPEQFKTCKAYDVGGVNILNKKPVDSKTALDKIKRRRETHNRVERRRRDCINQLIDELTALLPKDDDDSQSKCHRVNVLRTAVAHIQNLTQQNQNLNQQLEALQTGKPMPPPAIITTLAPIDMHNEEDNEDEDENDDGDLRDDLDLDREQTEDDSRSQWSYNSDTSPSSSFYAVSSSSHAPRSPISPLSATQFSPASSPRLLGQNHHGYGGGSGSGSGLPLAGQQWDYRSAGSSSFSHLAPFNISGSVSTDAATPLSSPSPSGGGVAPISRPISPSPLPSLNEMSMTLPSIPMIIEPSGSDPIPSPSSMDVAGDYMHNHGNNSVAGTGVIALGSGGGGGGDGGEGGGAAGAGGAGGVGGSGGGHARRMNRQTLPRLQLVPPPFHHRRSSGGGPSSPSYYGQDSLTSPASTYSGYSSASGPWSSSSSSLGPFSASCSSAGPLSPYSGSHGGSVGGGTGGMSPRSPGLGAGGGYAHHSHGGPPSPYSPNYQYHGPPSPYSTYSTYSTSPSTLYGGAAGTSTAATATPSMSNGRTES